MGRHKQVHLNFEGLLDNLIDGIIENQQNTIGVDIVNFVEEILFNGKGRLFPTQKALLRVFYGLQLTEEDFIFIDQWCIENKTTYIPGRKYKNLVLECGRRGGKSSLCSMIVLYEFYKLITLEDPALHYNLLPNSPIHILIFSQTFAQVKETLYAQVKGYAENCNYFKNLEKKGIINILGERIDCPNKNIAIYPKHTKNSESLVGYAIKILVLDEAARFDFDEFGVCKADDLWLNVGKACVDENTKLLTKEGYKSYKVLLEDYKQNKPIEIITYSPQDYKKQITDKLIFWDNGLQDIKRIKTFSGRTESVTLNHPFLVWKDTNCNPEWVNAADLKLGDLVASAKYLDIFNSEALLNNNEARLLGYLYGNGGISHRYKVTFTDDCEEILCDIQRILDVEFPGNTLKFTKEYHYSITNIAATNRNPNSLRKRLRELRIKNVKSPKKTIPNCITSGTKETIANFLNGLFATDGYVTTSVPQHIGISLSSKEMIEEIQRELIRFGIYSCIRYRKIKENINIKLNRSIRESETWVLEIRDFNSIRIFSEEIGIISKDNKLKEVLSIFSEDYKDIKSKSNFNLCPKGVNLRIKTLSKLRKIKFSELKVGYHWNRNKFNTYKVLRANTVLKDPVLENLISNFYWEPIVEIIEDKTNTIGIEVTETGIIGNPIITHNTRTFGDEGYKIAISSAWEENDYIQQLYELSKKDPSTIGFRFRTWDLNLSPHLSEQALRSSDDYIKDPITAALEYEGIRSIKRGQYLISENIETSFTGISAWDANYEALDIIPQNYSDDIRHYVGVKINRLEQNKQPSFLHVDYGFKKDSAALACCHTVKLDNGKLAIQIDGFLVWKPFVDVDKNNIAFPRVVSFLDVEDKIIKICSARNVIKCSFDQYNSQNTIQRLHMIGINTIEMSSTNEKQAIYYSVTKQLMDQGLLILPRDNTWTPTAKLELLNLIQLPNGRIDHPNKNHSQSIGKDIADAIVNSVYNCFSHTVTIGTNLGFNTSLIKTVNSKTLGQTPSSATKDLKRKYALKRLRAAKSSNII